MTTEQLARDLRHIARTLPGGHAADVCAAAADRLVTQQSVIGSLQSMAGAELSARHKAERELVALRRRTNGIDMPKADG
jgi:hypothetical protein